FARRRSPMWMHAKTVLALSLLSFIAAGCSSGEVRSGFLANGHAGDDDETVTLEQCPAAVQATIKEHAGDATIVEIERTTDHGEVLFEVDAQGADGIFEFDVAEDGTFRG